MDIEITVSGPDASEERVAEATGSLLKELRIEVEPNAKLVTHEGQVGDRGAAISFSQIALALVTGGAVSKLITALFGFLSINRKFRLKIKKSNGETLELSLDYLDRKGSTKAIEMVETFLTK